MMMDKDYTREKLFVKAEKEYNRYIESLKQKPPEQIISMCDEISTKSNIFSIFADERKMPTLSDRQVNGLLNFDNPIEACYNAWLKSGATYMDVVQESVELFAEQEAKTVEKNKRKDMER